MTIFRSLFWISCNFFIFCRNKFLYFIPMNSCKFCTESSDEIIKISFRTLKKTIIVKCGEIWFLWRNMILCSIQIDRCYSNLFAAGKLRCLLATLVLCVMEFIPRKRSIILPFRTSYRKSVSEKLIRKAARGVVHIVLKGWIDFKCSD